MTEPVGTRLAPPPRTIRPILAAQMMLGGSTSQLGWFFLGLGSFFFWLFVWQADFSGWRFRYSPVDRVQGQALGCSATRYSEDGSRYREGTRIMKTRYRYRVQGTEFEGVSYAPGQCVPSGEVAVEYLRQTPQIARVAGMRRQPLSAWAIFVVLFPGLGLVCVMVGLVRGRNRAHVLRFGLPTAGKLIDKVSTNTSTMGRTVYRMTFEYGSQSGTAGRITVRTNTPARLESSAREMVLYDPQDLTKAVVFADVPGKVDIDEHGELAAGSSAAFLILPALTILGNVLYVLTLAGGA